MTQQEIQQRMLDAYGIRVEPQMSAYVARKLAAAGSALRELPVIGGDAKTGVPVRVMVEPAKLVPLQ